MSSTAAPPDDALSADDALSVTVEIYGTGDDTVIVSGCEGGGQFAFGTGEFSAVLANPDGDRLMVAAWVTPWGWMVAAGAGPETRMAAWPATITRTAEDSPILRVEAPGGTRLELVSRRVGPPVSRPRPRAAGTPGPLPPLNRGVMAGHRNVQYNQFGGA